MKKPLSVCFGCVGVSGHLALVTLSLALLIGAGTAVAQTTNRQAIDFDGSGLKISNRDFFGATLSAPSEPATGSTRLTWRYALVDRSDWSLRIGLTGNSPETRLPVSQTGIVADQTSFGFVPQIHLYGESRLSDRVRLVGDIDSQTSGATRSVDLGLRVRYSVSNDMAVSAGLRMLEATGTDNRDAYGFGRFTSFTFGLGYRF